MSRWMEWFLFHLRLVPGGAVPPERGLEPSSHRPQFRRNWRWGAVWWASVKSLTAHSALSQGFRSNDVFSPHLYFKRHTWKFSLLRLPGPHPARLVLLWFRCQARPQAVRRQWPFQIQGHQGESVTRVVVHDRLCFCNAGWEMRSRHRPDFGYFGVSTQSQSTVTPRNLLYLLYFFFFEPFCLQPLWNSSGIQTAFKVPKKTLQHWCLYPVSQLNWNDRSPSFAPLAFAWKASYESL